MSIEQFIKKNKQFWWYVKNPSQLDDKAVVEGVIKYGDMKEIKQMIEIFGVRKTARIFFEQTSGKRRNYDAKTVNYFKQYFKQYAK